MAKPLIQNPEDIRLREEQEIQQLLGHPPRWLHNGAIIVAVATVGLFFIGHFMRYPDVVPAPATLMTENPIVQVTARVDGKLTALMVSNQESVQRDQLLGILETPALLADVTQVENLIPAIENAVLQKNLAAISLPKQPLQLGPIQNSYALLAQHLQDQRFLLDKDHVAARTASLERQIAGLRKRNAAVGKQIEVIKEELALAENLESQNKNLLDREAASGLEYETARSNRLRYKRELETKRTELVDQEVAIEQLKDQILNLRLEQENQLATGWSTLLADLKVLRSAIEQWRQDYLLVSPMAGQVVLPAARKPGVSINNREVVMTVIPPGGTGQILAVAVAPPDNLGKVTVGQRAQLRLDGYPYKEFGTLDGEVAHVAKAPSTDGSQSGQFQIHIHFPDTIQRGDTLLTTHDKPVVFLQGMRATARIITKDRSFLARVWERLLGMREG